MKTLISLQNRTADVRIAVFEKDTSKDSERKLDSERKFLSLTIFSLTRTFVTKDLSPKIPDIARMAEQADAADSKSADLTVMGVRFPLRAPSNTAKNYSSPSCAKIIPRNISDTSPTLTQNFERTKMASFYKRKLADSTVWEVKIRRKGYPIQMHSFDKREDAEK